MGVLLLVRHGQASLGMADYDRLSELGRRQARSAGARLARADLTIDQIFCGGLERQRDTAAELLAELGRPQTDLSIDDRLDEYDHVGVMGERVAGVSFAAATTPEAGRSLQSALDEAIARWMAADEGYPETHADFVRRVQEAVSSMLALPGTTLAVTSAGVIAYVCTHVLGLPAERWPGLARIVVNASVTKLITGGTGTHLLAFNDHGHLEDDRSLITYR